MNSVAMGRKMGEASVIILAKAVVARTGADATVCVLIPA